MNPSNKLSIALAALTFSIAISSALAGDLADSALVNKQTRAVDVFEITGVEIKKQDYSTSKPNENLTVENLKAVVSVKVSVEGNICLNSPESLAVHFDKVAGSKDKQVTLTTSGPYHADPWGPISACTSHSKRSEVVIPLSIDWHQYSDGPESSSSWRYLFKTQSFGSTQPKILAIRVNIVEFEKGQKSLKVS